MGSCVWPLQASVNCSGPTRAQLWLGLEGPGWPSKSADDEPVDIAGSFVCLFYASRNIVANTSYQCDNRLTFSETSFTSKTSDIKSRFACKLNYSGNVSEFLAKYVC